MVSGTVNKQLMFCSMEPSDILEAKLETRVQEGGDGEKRHLSKALAIQPESRWGTPGPHVPDFY